MTISTPKTRRQLRAALEQTKALSEARAEDANKLRALEESVKADGWTPEYAPSRIVVTDLFTGKRVDAPVDWTAPDRTAERAAAEAATRRETLAKVIEALGLSGYADSFSQRAGIRPSGADRLWADIETALEVRAERKAADERTTTEARISSLAKPNPFVTGGFVSRHLGPWNFDFGVAIGNVVGDGDRPDKAPKGGTTPVDKPKPKKPTAKKSTKGGKK